jgi:hypothetical protein
MITGDFIAPSTCGSLSAQAVPRDFSERSGELAYPHHSLASSQSTPGWIGREAASSSGVVSLTPCVTRRINRAARKRTQRLRVLLCGFAAWRELFVGFEHGTRSHGAAVDRDESNGSSNFTQSRHAAKRIRTTKGYSTAPLRTITGAPVAPVETEHRRYLPIGRPSLKYAVSVSAKRTRRLS